MTEMPTHFPSHILPEHDVRPYSVAQLADRWGCSDSMIRKLIKQGQLQAFNIGVLMRISAAEVARYEAQTVALAPRAATDDERPVAPAKPKGGRAMVHATPRNIPRAPRRRSPIALPKRSDDD
jgi:excisionase family DNA binding protein